MMICKYTLLKVVHKNLKTISTESKRSTVQALFLDQGNLQVNNFHVHLIIRSPKPRFRVRINNLSEIDLAIINWREIKTERISITFVDNPRMEWNGKGKKTRLSA